LAGKISYSEAKYHINLFAIFYLQHHKNQHLMQPDFSGTLRAQLKRKIRNNQNGGRPMGIFTRFCDIVNSNINGMLDRAEDPEKLIRLMIQEMEDTLVEIKAASAGVMAGIKKVERQMEGARKNVDFWEEKAELAVSKGREDLARQALIEKRKYTHMVQALENELVEHKVLIDQYKEDMSQLEEKLKSARKKEKILIQRHIHASNKKRAQEEMRRFEGSDVLIKFDELENRIERMEAEADLVNFGKKSSLHEEMEKLAVDEEIERELQALKSSSKPQSQEPVILADSST
jgi:phage shock protein A